MKNNLLLSSAIIALLTTLHVQAQEAAAPPPNQPAPPNLQQLREELRDLPPEERRARMQEFRSQNAPRQGGPAAQPFAGRQGMQRPGMAAGGGAGRLLTVLTPEQRQSLREANEENRDQTRDLQEKLREARKAVAEASFAGEFNEAALREKLEAAAKLDTELAIIRARALSQIDPPLSPEQLEQIKNPPPAVDRRPGNQPGQFQPPPPGGQPLPNSVPPNARPGRRGPPGNGQGPPPDQF